MMRCPACTHASHTRTSRYLSERTKEVYYQCQNMTCSCTFKTIESVDKILCQPLSTDELNAQRQATQTPQEKRTLNRYNRYHRNQTRH